MVAPAPPAAPARRRPVVPVARDAREFAALFRSALWRELEALSLAEHDEWGMRLAFSRAALATWPAGVGSVGDPADVRGEVLSECLVALKTPIDIEEAA